MQLSVTSSEVTDSARQNADPLYLRQLNAKAKERIAQQEIHKNIETAEREQADKELKDSLNTIDSIKDLNLFLKENYPDNPKARKLSLSFFEEQISLGIPPKTDEISTFLDREIMRDNELSVADRIIKLEEELTQQGKSSQEILQLLISNFENETAVQTWVENWKNFQRLSQFAQSKPPQEQKAILSIVGKADFSSATAFETSLTAISKSSDISEATKVEIMQEFKGSSIKSVVGMDAGLKQAKLRKEQFSKVIKQQTQNSEMLSSEIESLENKLEDLEETDPEREDLENQIKQKKEALEQTNKQLTKLKREQPKDISYKLREGFTVLKNQDNSRSIQIDGLGFSLTLPSNRLPFQSLKNLRSVNTAFVYSSLKQLEISQFIFSPELKNNELPTKAQRDMCHTILDSLGFNDNRILDQQEINELNNYLSQLVDKEEYLYPVDRLIALNLYNPVSQKTNIDKLEEMLKSIKENF